jgi:hypothetical protein
MGVGVREPLHQADIGALPLSTGFTLPLPGWYEGDQGRPGLTFCGYLQ